MAVTAEIARFAASLRWDDIPDRVRDNAVLAILDSIGTVFAGLDEESVRLVREAALREGGEGGAVLIGAGTTAAGTAAALANGAAAHALDYDSISLTVSGFIASPTLFAILGAAGGETGPVSGRRLVEAFVAGWEAEAAIARGLGVLHYAKGWHSTATLGHFGAAVGAGRLLGLTAEQMQYCIGVAASEASGLRTMIGNMTNPFHVGKAARNGLMAARLAKAGFRAAPDAVEHPRGFAVAFNGADGFDLDAMTAGLGSAWDLVDPGLVIKVYPCCGLIHSAIDAMLALRREEALEPTDVTKVTVAVHALVPPTMKFDRPASGYEAKFSTPFCMATALVEGAVRLEHFSDARATDPDLNAVMRRVEMVVHPDLTDHSTFLHREFSEVTVHLADGRTCTRRVDRIDNRGSRGNPADLDLIREKFDDCLTDHPAAARAREAFAILSRPEALADIRPVLEMLK